MARVVPWYKIPVLRYLLAEEYEYVLYLDADAYVVRTELSLPLAVPTFYDNPTKAAFAP